MSPPTTPSCRRRCCPTAPTAPSRSIAARGDGGRGFFQRHAGKGFPEALKIVEIAESDGERAPYMYLTTAEGLVAAAQMGTIEFTSGARGATGWTGRTAWSSTSTPTKGWAGRMSPRRRRSARPARRSRPAVLGAGFRRQGRACRRGTEAHRRMGDGQALLARDRDSLMTRDMPERFTAEMSKAKRKGRIFIDWLRNDRGGNRHRALLASARERPPPSTRGRHGRGAGTAWACRTRSASARRGSRRWSAGWSGRDKRLGCGKPPHRSLGGMLFSDRFTGQISRKRPEPVDFRSFSGVLHRAPSSSGQTGFCAPA
jgi:hypothetical protein